MSDQPKLLYIEADDEVTTVVRRIREADSERVVLVVPGRSRATSSAVALRLLARVGEDAGVAIAVSGDALTRSLASEAGLETYASVDDARNAKPAPSTEAATRRASIHVVRGEAVDVSPVPVAPLSRVDATMVRPVMRSARATRRRRSMPAVGGLALVLALVVVGGVLAAAVLPAATIELTPDSEALAPVAYEIQVTDTERTSGTVEDTVSVGATGTYPIQVAATGVVTLLNFSSSDVQVDQGTLVAAELQAFETDAAVVVPAGSLTVDGRVQSGVADVSVTAAAVGEAANVPAMAIDTVLGPADARLRGFSNNSLPVVQNDAPTAGGLDTTGVEITQADVDAAVAALREALVAEVDEVLGSDADLVSADAGAEAPEPVIEGLEGLAGTREPADVELSGSLAYDRLAAERATVVALARERLAADAGVLPVGHELVPGETRVTIGTARAEGDRLVVSVSVSGASAPRLDRDAIAGRVRGLAVAEAEAALEELGMARVELWPGWVASVPELDWRIDVRFGAAAEEPEASATP